MTIFQTKFYLKQIKTNKCQCGGPLERRARGNFPRCPNPP